MANYNNAIRKTLKNEGGYNLPYGTSGETYKGIDRKYKPNWKGWGIIDAIKKTRRIGEEEEIKNNPQLEQLVVDFYKTEFWDKSKSELIQNDDLASFYFDFYVHKPAITIMALNSIAVAFNVVSTSNAVLQSNVIDLMNNNAEYFYSKLYALRNLHYNNQYLNVLGKEKILYVKSKIGVLNRLYKYPSSIQDMAKKKISNKIATAYNNSSLSFFVDFFK